MCIYYPTHAPYRLVWLGCIDLSPTSSLGAAASNDHLLCGCSGGTQRTRRWTRKQRRNNTKQTRTDTPMLCVCVTSPTASGKRLLLLCRLC